MGVIKTREIKMLLDDLISFQGNLPDDVKEEAYILYDLGFDFSEIEKMIYMRTKDKR